MRTLLTFSLLCLLFSPFLSEAQVTSFQQNISIETKPFFPSANTETEISLNAYTIDTTGASIRWFVDGIEKTEARNQRSFLLTTKETGEETTVLVNLELFSGQTLTREIEINPTRVDMVIEADTTAPSFYQGRPLPTKGSKVRIIATPHTGEDMSPREMTYLWKHDNKVLYGGPVKGKQVAEIEAGLGREQIITVDVIGKDNTTLAKQSIVLPMAEPEVVFYEENPLKGASQLAMNEEHYMTSDSTTLRAEPYYMSSDIFSTNPIIEWTIDGKEVKNPNIDPRYLILEKNESGGSSRIGFHIRNPKQLLQGVKSQFIISF